MSDNTLAYIGYDAINLLTLDPKKDALYVTTDGNETFIIERADSKPANTQEEVRINLFRDTANTSKGTFSATAENPIFLPILVAVGKHMALHITSYNSNRLSRGMVLTTKTVRSITVVPLDMVPPMTGN
ncbi:MAG: hypothetical protein Q4B06_00960 [Candidatus Saccharibacteria bacterium]|nr:hypothetical protein [Candidatus Saccharibacteria bacterium]